MKSLTLFYLSLRIEEREKTGIKGGVSLHGEVKQRGKKTHTQLSNRII